MRLISGPDLRRLVPMRDAIRAVHDAFAQLSAGAATVPTRLSVPLKKGDVALVMPGTLRQPAIFSLKAVTVIGDNPRRGLPRVQATVFAFDPATGELEGIIEGAALTALRTGAATGVATRLLARRDAKTALVFGAGPQAETQVEALVAVRKLDGVRLVSRRKELATRLRRRLRERLDVPIQLGVPGDARTSDVIVTATNATQPVFDGNDAQPGVHVNAIGSYHAGMRELDDAFLRRVHKIVVDTRDAAWKEAGELIQARRRRIVGPRSIHAELGELCRGAKPGRESRDEITLFKSVGNAVQDAAVAALALRRAHQRGVGTDVELPR